MSNYKYEETEDITLFIRFLESIAEDVPYLDPDYKIVVIDCCTTPFIVMSQEEFDKLERRIIGDG